MTELQFVQENLVSNIKGVAKFTDPKLVNAWGLVLTGKEAWVAATGTSYLLRYNRKTGVSSGKSILTPASPTGIVENKNHEGFLLRNGNGGKIAKPAQIIVVTESGRIAAYNELIDEEKTIIMVDNSRFLANYKGAAIVGKHLFVANFYSGMIEKYNDRFEMVSSFTDTDLLATGYAPFNIVSIHGYVVVAYAKQDADKHDDVAGPGNGHIYIFDTDGNLRRKFASGGTLNAPWAMVPIAPRSHDGDKRALLLVGNFGDGTIGVFELRSGKHLQNLQDHNGMTISIDGLWGLAKGKGSSTLVFAAGPGEESNGLVGRLELDKQLIM